MDEWYNGPYTIKLSQFNIQYRSRTAIKAQTLADFIVEFTAPKHEESQERIWMVYTDGSSTQKRGGASVVINSPEGDILKYGIQLKFPITNNEAEYEAMLMGLRMALALGAENILLKSDSQLVIGKVKGDFEARQTRMQKYLKLMNQLASNFDHAEFIQIPRDQNAETDKVAQSTTTDDQGKAMD